VIVLDSGVLIAAVVVEVCWMLGRRVSVDAESTFLRGLGGDGLTVETITTTDYQRVADLVDTYRNLPLGTVDAMVVAVAERLGVTTIGTVDRRDFTIVRPRHVEAFTLLP
jgi:uncharacterized protein